MSSLLAGALAFSLIGAVVGVAVVTLLQGVAWAEIIALLQEPYLQRVIQFTFWQATLSTLLSVGLAIPVARALARRHFPGRTGLIRLLGLPMVTPAIVAVFGLVEVFGQRGWLGQLAEGLGWNGWPSLYGLGGILLAHVFFNLPLTVRLLLPLWGTIPGESWRLASQLGLNSWMIWWLLEWPLLRQVLPGVAGLVFMLCFTSFAVVLTLGGGPAATTLEVAIYQALRFDFELSRAALLALLQMLICLSLVLWLQSVAKMQTVETVSGAQHSRPDVHSVLGIILDTVFIGVCSLLLLLPLVAVVWGGLNGPWGTVLSDPGLWRATWRSLGIALSAALIAVILAWALASGGCELRVRRQRRRWADLLELGGSMTLAVPILVLGTGWFILLQARIDVLAAGLWLVLPLQAMLVLPFALRLLAPPLVQTAQRYDRLCASLGLSGWRRWYWLEWPLLRRPLGLALALGAALAVGDLGAIALFGVEQTKTLPLLLYQRLASYQIGAAGVTALILLLLALLLFAALERFIGGARRA